MKKVAVVALVLAAIGGGAFWFVSKSSASPREEFARNVVRALAANNWEHSTLGTFLCDNKIIRQMYDRDAAPLSFADYREYGGVKSIGKIKLVPPVAFPNIAMDTFVPVLFEKKWIPYSAMPDHLAYRAAYIQLATQESSPGQWCLVGWGRNDFPVDLDQADDFLTHRGIFADN